MSEPRSNPIFLDLEDAYCDPANSPVVVLPVPFERTTSYGTGTASGPAATLDASQQVELYDEELRSEPYREGIATLPALKDQELSATAYLERLKTVVGGCLESNQFVLCLGGEHTLTQAPVAAALSVHGTIGIVQFDAHADLRDTYEGISLSHACVMRRVHEMGIPALGVGIRSLSPAEAAFIERQQLSMIWGQELPNLTLDRFRSSLRALPTKVYLTFDVDFLDPSLIPATGTPEPGGGLWWPTLGLLRILFEEKEVVAMDLVELAPIADQRASEFTVARLAYKCIAYRQAARAQRAASPG